MKSSAGRHVNAPCHPLGCYPALGLRARIRDKVVSVRAYRRVQIQFHSLTLPLHGGESLASRSSHFIPRKEPSCLSNERQGGPQSRYVQFGQEKNFLCLPGFIPSTVERRKEALKLGITKGLNSAGLLCIILGEVD